MAGQLLRERQIQILNRLVDLCRILVADRHAIDARVPERVPHRRLAVLTGEALAEIDRAAGLDPLSPVVYAAGAQIHLYACRYDAALEQCRKAFELDRDFVLALYFEGRVYQQKEMYSQAIVDFQRAEALSGGLPMTIMALGSAYALSGDQTQARQQLGRLEELSARRYVSAVYPMALCAVLGDSEQAFKWLQKAYDNFFNYLVYISGEPGLGSFQSDPRFKSVMRQIGVPSLTHSHSGDRN